MREALTLVLTTVSVVGAVYGIWRHAQEHARVSPPFKVVRPLKRIQVPLLRVLRATRCHPTRARRASRVSMFLVLVLNNVRRCSQEGPVPCDALERHGYHSSK